MRGRESVTHHHIIIARPIFFIRFEVTSFANDRAFARLPLGVLGVLGG
jgi:hypothetical protein